MRFVRTWALAFAGIVLAATALFAGAAPRLTALAPAALASLALIPFCLRRARTLGHRRGLAIALCLFTAAVLASLVLAHAEALRLQQLLLAALLLASAALSVRAVALSRRSPRRRLFAPYHA